MKLNHIAAIAVSAALGSAAVTYGLRPAAPAASHAAESRDDKANPAATDAEHDKSDAHGHAEKDGHAGDRVEMAEATIKTAAIEIATAGPASLIGKEPLPGEIRFNQDRLADVTPRVNGVAVSVHKNLGDRVKKGDLLVVLESQALAALRSDYLSALKRLELARATFAREKRLWQDKISAEQDMLQAQKDLAEAEIAVQAAADRLRAIGAGVSTQSRDLARFELRAPLDGLITEKHLTAGEAVKEDANLFQIADLSSVWAEISLYPKNLNQIRLGQKVTVKAAELNMETSANVSYIGALVGEQTRTAKARVTLANGDGRWRPGLFVTIEVAEGEVKVPLAVKASALQTHENRQVVFVREGNAFEARPVQVGRRDGDWAEVTSGLKPGERYAATNSFIVKAELGKASAAHED
jgi:cobalt-zinc-cadmium efflux system membrane fusion protein